MIYNNDNKNKLNDILKTLIHSNSIVIYFENIVKVYFRRLVCHCCVPEKVGNETTDTQTSYPFWFPFQLCWDKVMKASFKNHPIPFHNNNTKWIIHVDHESNNHTQWVHVMKLLTNHVTSIRFNSTSYLSHFPLWIISTEFFLEE